MEIDIFFKQVIKQYRVLKKDASKKWSGAQISFKIIKVDNNPEEIQKISIEMHRRVKNNLENKTEWNFTMLIGFG